MRKLSPLAYHAAIFAIAFIGSIAVNDGVSDVPKNIGAAFGFWVMGAIGNRFGNRLVGIAMTIAFACLSYIGRD